MRAISIRQPWAWLILHAGKDIENRTWHTQMRGRVLIHAAKGMTRKEYEFAMAYYQNICPGAFIPPMETLERGGIVGSVEIVDCVDASDSPWYMGEVGFVLKNPRVLPFTPYKGQLNFFEVAVAE